MHHPPSPGLFAVCPWVFCCLATATGNSQRNVRGMTIAIKTWPKQRVGRGNPGVGGAAGAAAALLGGSWSGL